MTDRSVRFGKYGLTQPFMFFLEFTKFDIKWHKLWVDRDPLQWPLVDLLAVFMSAVNGRKRTVKAVRIGQHNDRFALIFLKMTACAIRRQT